MGYTHYWKQKRDFKADEWAEISENIGLILKDVEHNQGIRLGDGKGKRRSHPIITNTEIMFNGIGANSHETFVINRKRPPLEAWQTKDRRGCDFCKTDRKPYDLAVTACLSYLATVVESHEVSSDGSGADWLEGVEEARRALPRYANILDIPFGVMESDRWVGPWVRVDESTGFRVAFCIDGHGYIIRNKTRESYRFESHMALARFLRETQASTEYDAPRRSSFGWTPTSEPNIWNATGSFDKARIARIARLQKRVLTKLFPVPAANAHQPPTHVRPNQFPVPEYAYYFSDLLKEAS